MNKEQWDKTIEQFKKLEELNHRDKLRVKWQGYRVRSFYIYDTVDISLDIHPNLHVCPKDTFSAPFQCFTVEEYKDVTKKYLRI